VTDAGCPACLGRWPAPEQKIAELGRSIAYLHADQFFPGWTFLVLKRHATELFHLEPAERDELMAEVSRVAAVLATVFQARKMNYELLGNQIAHIHWHLVPRRADDPRPAEPPWVVAHEPRLLDAAARDARIAEIRRGLSP
jgi:diadenosine tetraphosphate (Ap4A) HIT family hydrolase